MAAVQISPGMTHPPSRLCPSDLRRVVPCKYWIWPFSLPRPNASPHIRFLFVRPALCLGLPSDSQSPAKPLPLANTSPCRVCRGLSPPSECALPGARKKGRPARVSLSDPAHSESEAEPERPAGYLPHTGDDPPKRRLIRRHFAPLATTIIPFICAQRASPLGRSGCIESPLPYRCGVSTSRRP
jgi:hypothetical protein